MLPKSRDSVKKNHTAPFLELCGGFGNILVRGCSAGPFLQPYKYLKKGSKCGVVGSLQTRSYDATDGTKRYSTEVVAEEVEFLSTKGNASGDELVQDEPAGSKSSGKNDVVNKFEPIDDDNLPF